MSSPIILNFCAFLGLVDILRRNNNNKNPENLRLQLPFGFLGEQFEIGEGHK